MKIIKRRVRNVETYLSTVRENEEFHIAFLDLENYTERLNQIGFTIELNIGEQVLPMILGPIPPLVLVCYEYLLSNLITKYSVCNAGNKTGKPKTVAKSR